MAIAPILQIAAATGVLGGRSLIRRRAQARADQQATDLTNILLGGQTGAGGVGPPTPGLANELAGTDLALLNYLQRTDPQAALKLAGQFNQAQQPARQAAQEAQARQMAALDPAQSDLLAQNEGRGQFQVIEQLPDGTSRTVVSDTQGSQRYNENLDQYRAVVQLQEDGQRMQELIAQLPPGAAALDTDNPLAMELRGLQKKMVSGIRRAEKLGALDQGSLDFINELIPGGVTLSDVLASPEALIAGVQTGLGLFADKQRNLDFDMRHYQGINPQLRARANAITEVRANRAAQVAQFEQPEFSRAGALGEAQQQTQDTVRQLIQAGAQTAADLSAAPGELQQNLGTSSAPLEVLTQPNVGGALLNFLGEDVMRGPIGIGIRAADPTGQKRSNLAGFLEGITRGL